jgi:thiol:disulfide interchange protein DsbD
MDGLKKALAFPMYGAAAWLAWVFARETGVDGLPFLFAAAIVLSLSVWLWGASQRGVAPALMRVFAILALIATGPLAFAGSQMTLPAEASNAPSTTAGFVTEPWSPERVAALQVEGRPVFVDFTAAWCVTCQVNERTALATDSVKAAFARDRAVYLKADWTNRNPEIAKALAAQGRSGVPLYLVYGKGAQPVVLPQLLSEGIVVEALDNAARG